MSRSDCFSRKGFEILNEKDLDFILSLVRSCITKGRLSNFMVDKKIGGLKADRRELMQTKC